MLADVHLPVKPRSDLALVNGIIHILIEQRSDRSRVHRRRTRPGFDALRESVREYARARVGDHRALGRADLPDGVALRAAPAPAFIAWTMGVNHSSKGTETVNAINNLALITGNIGRTGASPFSITGQCNAMGTREAGFASSLPGYRKFESAEPTATSWRRSGTCRSSGCRRPRGLAYPDIIEAALEKQVRALWIIATNPIVSFPNLGVLKQALETLEFLVVQDGFHPTPTSELRGPRAAGRDLGREGRDLHELGAARQQGQSRGRRRRARRASDFDIFLDLAGALGCRDESCFQAGRSRRTRSTSGSACQRAACATTRA